MPNSDRDSSNSRESDLRIANQPERLATLVATLVEQGLTQSDRTELARILESSDEAKCYYLHYIQLHSELESQWNGGRTHLTSRRKVQASKPLSSYIMPALFTAIVATAAVLFVMLNPFARDHLHEVAADKAVIMPHRQDTQALASKHNAFDHREDSTAGVAIVVHTQGLEPGSNIRVGQRLAPGWFELLTGTVRLHFVNGATVALEGPAVLKIKSAMLATLHSGSATTRVTDRAKGFVLNSPGAAVVDLGTEFRLMVDSVGGSIVEVIDGEVELSLLGDDGTTLTSRQVMEKQKVAISPSEMKLTEIESFEPTERMDPPADHALPIDLDYVSRVESKHPIAYWRFEKLDKDIVSNEIEGAPALRMQRGEADPDSLRLIDGYLRLRRSETPRYLVTKPLLSGLMTSQHTVEAWIAPDDLRHASYLSLFPDWSQFGYQQFLLLEVATDTSWVHLPGSIRFLCRYPPARSSALGLNLFSAGMVTPGQWHHVVTRSSGSTLSLFVDGALVREIPNRQEQAERDEPLRCLIGQLTLNQNWRQFAGMIDEVAIYRRALTDEEILEHYNAVSFASGPGWAGEHR
ncbi:MAG: LamG-like jellyroll fold domain-containing protein [Planctomycetota bacterium]